MTALHIIQKYTMGLEFLKMNLEAVCILSKKTAVHSTRLLLSHKGTIAHREANQCLGLTDLFTALPVNRHRNLETFLGSKLFTK